MNIYKWRDKLLGKKRPKRLRELRIKYPQYEIGRATYGGAKILDWGEGAVFKIGAFCSIATGVKIFLGGEHRVDWVTTYPFSRLWKSGEGISGHPRTKGDVVIGNDVWIGTEAMIMSGVTIGDGAVVAARSMVTRDIEPYAIYAGNPARLIKKRFDEETIWSLLEIAWWNFPDEEIERLLPLMLSNGISAFITEARRLKRI
ncbi:MAG: CatB-related O-acetyltransferase [Pseudomonadota bacterium]